MFTSLNRQRVCQTIVSLLSSSLYLMEIVGMESSEVLIFFPVTVVCFCFLFFKYHHCVYAMFIVFKAPSALCSLGPFYGMIGDTTFCLLFLFWLIFVFERGIQHQSVAMRFRQIVILGEVIWYDWWHHGLSFQWQHGLSFRWQHGLSFRWQHGLSFRWQHDLSFHAHINFLLNRLLRLVFAGFFFSFLYWLISVLKAGSNISL